MRIERLASAASPRISRRMLRDRHLYWSLTGVWLLSLAALIAMCVGLLAGPVGDDIAAPGNTGAVLLGFGTVIYVVGSLRPWKLRKRLRN